MVDIPRAFPELAEISDSAVRAAVRDCWASACEDNGVEALADVPWFPPVQRDLDIPDETLVNHVRDVVAAACGLAESLERSRLPCTTCSAIRTSG